MARTPETERLLTAIAQNAREVRAAEARLEHAREVGVVIEQEVVARKAALASLQEQLVVELAHRSQP